MPLMTKQPTRGWVGACLHVWLPGLVAGVADASQNAAPSAADDLTKKVIKSVRACARMGHPTPMAFAMQSRHHFWYFRLPVWFSCEHVRYL
jgi:dihydrodipicolinate synthase/N-acetylneuraminate lyase